MPGLIDKTSNVIHSESVQTIPQQNNVQLNVVSKSTSYFIDEYNDSMGKLNALIYSLENNQLDRDILIFSLTNKIVVAMEFLREYSPSSFKTSFEAIDLILMRLKPIPLTVDPLFVFE